MCPSTTNGASGKLPFDPLTVGPMKRGSDLMLRNFMRAVMRALVGLRAQRRRWSTSSDLAAAGVHALRGGEAQACAESARDDYEHGDGDADDHARRRGGPIRRPTA